MKKILSYIFVLGVINNYIAQSFYGVTIDEKLSLQKNRIGFSIYKQNRQNTKIGLSINYNNSYYKYPSDVTKLNNMGTGYIANDRLRPPYSKNLGINSTSFVRGFGLDFFYNLRLKTFKKSNLDLKFLFGFVGLLDSYKTDYFGENRHGNNTFFVLEGSMNFTYLIWSKNIGIEPFIGLPYFMPVALLSGKPSYDSRNPFVGAEIEIGISIYYQRKSKQR